MTGQGAPLAAVGRHVQDGIDHLQARQPHIAALARQRGGSLLELFRGELRFAILAQIALGAIKRENALALLTHLGLQVVLQANFVNQVNLGF